MEKDEVHTQKTKDIEQWETLAFYFTQLSKRLSQDREHWAETGKDLTKGVEKLDRITQKFTELENKLKEKVITVIQQQSQEAAGTIAKACSETTQQILAEQIKTTADCLSKAVYQASGTLTNYQTSVKSFKKWFMIGIASSALITNILAGAAIYYFLPLIEKRSIKQSLEAIRAIEEREKKQAPLSPAPRVQNKSLK